MELTRDPTFPHSADDFSVRDHTARFVVRKPGPHDFEYPLALDFLKLALYSLKRVGVDDDSGGAAPLAHHDWTLPKFADNLRSVSLKIGNCDLLDHSIPRCVFGCVGEY
jgi:hypothetical protein